MKDDPNVLFYNPASLGTLTLPRISASYLKHLMDVNSGSLSYGQYIQGIGNIGAGITYINYGTVQLCRCGNERFWHIWGE